MALITRRKFLETAAALGATLAWPSAYASDSKISWTERRDLFPQGVASGDPQSDSVILWTRRPPSKENEAKELILEIANDQEFRNVVATATAKIGPESDWTCRVLAAHLQPGHVYWYRFTDEHGFGSRIGRTITAPANNDDRPVSFSFVSCQNVQQGASTAYRRMIWEDEKRPDGEQLSFVLHLGDFLYELVWYPEDRPQGMYDRRLRDIVRYPNGEKINDFHVPTTLEDYRVLYRAYLSDPDLQDARARWPFVCVWDNHEFSWRGWQSQQNFGNGPRPAQKVKVAANQVWFEYQPARVERPGNPKHDHFEAPAVTNTVITKFDEHGLGMESGNIAAINSLKIFRTLRFGHNFDLILTDNHSFRSEPVTEKAETEQFQTKEMSLLFPQDILEILDAGRTYNDGHPPDTIEFDGKKIQNPQKNAPPQTVLGAKQKIWFLEQLRASKTPWKLWGNSFGSLDMRLDVQNLPPDFTPRWPSSSYGSMGGDWSGYRTERNEILNFVKREQLTGLVTIVGDRHSFFAGLLSPALPPDSFEPVAAEFITGSVSAPGLVEAFSYRLEKDDPVRPLFLYQPSSGVLQPAINFSLMHGVRASLTLQRTGDLKKALAESNPAVSPHLSFVDMGGHGYSVVRATADELQVEFVCIPRPIERSERPDGGELAYRIAHRLKLWKPDSTPRLERTKIEGNLPLGG
jgi:alkaline phosphatase D